MSYIPQEIITGITDPIFYAGYHGSRYIYNRMSLKRQLSVTASVPSYGGSKRRKSVRFGRLSKKSSNILFMPNKALRYGEKKSLDYSTNTNVVPIMSAATFTMINAIQSGTGAYQMVGRHANLESMLIRYHLKVTPQVGASFTTLAIPVVARIVVVYDKSPNATLPGLSDVITPTTDELRGLNLQNSDRFIVLVDKILPMGYNSLITGGITYNAQGGVQNELINVYKKMNLPFTGPSTAGGIAGVTEGAIYSSVFSDTANNGLVYDISVRFRFVDK